MIGPFGMTVKSTMRERALPLAQALSRLGHSLTLLIPPWDSPEEAGTTYVVDGVTIINVGLPRVKGLFFYGGLTQTLVREAQRLSPDVIYFFKPKAYAGLSHAAFYYLRQAGIAGAQMIVDEDDWELAWNKLNNYSSLQKWVFAKQEPWGLQHADFVTVASLALLDLVASLKVEQSRLHYLPNGVTQSQLKPMRPSQTSDNWVRAKYGLAEKPTVLLITRFFEFRLSLLQEVIKQVSTHLPDTHWLIVGQGYFGEEDALKFWGQEVNLSEKMIFTGWVEQSTLPDYYAAAQVAIYPYDDTVLNRTKCSVKLLDMLARGMPVVASQVGQNAAYIRPDETGLLVPPDDAEAMADAVCTMLTDAVLRDRLGETSHHYIAETYQWDLLARELENKVLNKNDN
ncbi:MAG: glycosyltransferase family 4 protein [Chloroflexota bacterium]